MIVTHFKKIIYTTCIYILKIALFFMCTMLLMCGYYILIYKLYFNQHQMLGNLQILYSQSLDNIEFMDSKIIKKNEML